MFQSQKSELMKDEFLFVLSQSLELMERINTTVSDTKYVYVYPLNLVAINLSFRLQMIALDHQSLSSGFIFDPYFIIYEPPPPPSPPHTLYHMHPCPFICCILFLPSLLIYMLLF
jgi:hypothetical protein